MSAARSLNDILGALDKVQASPLPLVQRRAKPGELTLLRALADAVRVQLAAGGEGRHTPDAIAALDRSQDGE